MKKRIGLFVLLGWIMGTTATGWAAELVVGPPSLAAFDEDVAVCRRVVRQYCAIVQQMVPAPTVDQAQQAEGLRLLAEARKRWSEIQSGYGSNPPAEYLADKTFKARLQDFAYALEDMEAALNAGDARRSLLACGFGCGLFVGMHEQNGLSYAIDKLYHLRADLKTTHAVMKTQGLGGVRARLPGLLQKRDIVLMAPAPFAPGHENAATYRAAVEELSRMMDQLASAVTAGDPAQVELILANGLKVVNKPYGIVL